MEHHLDDSLNLESTMGVDFNHATDVVVSQADITLDNVSQEDEISMEFEEQPILMETGNEEIIVPELMGEEFTLTTDTDYTIEDDQMSETSIVESNALNILKSQGLMDLQFEPQTLLTTNIEHDDLAEIVPLQKSSAPMRITSGQLRQVPIAPKPMQPGTKIALTAGKQYAIAPKPVALITNKSSNATVKKVPLSSVMQSANKSGSTVLAQIGKQLVVVPAGGSQKIKLVQKSSGNVQYIRKDSEQAQLINPKNLIGTQNAKPLLTKVIVQADNKVVPTITKVVSSNTSLQQQTRFVTVHQKSMQFPIKNKYLTGSPKKTSVKIAKAATTQSVMVKSPTPKLLPAPQTVTNKKILIPANPQNVIIKSVPSKPTQILKADGNFINVTNVTSAPHTQLHQVNVPGKGVQYIKLLSNSSSSVNKATVVKPQAAGSLLNTNRTYVLTDSKGNIIQLASEKVSTNNPPPLVLTGNNVINKLTSKPQQKLVRIAPVSKTQTHMIQTTRSSQSLLAPITPAEEPPPPPAEPAPEPEDSKAALRAFIAETIMGDHAAGAHQGMEIKFERIQSPVHEEMSNSMDQDEANEEHPVIVIPANYQREEEDSMKLEHFMNMDQDIGPYESPKTSQENVELGLRPRKACNCTKSQCLKLYCDCFANGEFCNQCNCTNCHNNLENEELRQKAIRGCLERNPNAFRPKIGKAKSSAGPDTVRRHNKGCNCKRSGCLKNYCECYEAKIACSAICKCVGCRNVEDSSERARRPLAARAPPGPPPPALKQPCSFMTSEVIEAACQCLLAAATPEGAGADPARSVLEEFARCLQEIIGTAHHAARTDLAV